MAVLEVGVEAYPSHDLVVRDGRDCPRGGLLRGPACCAFGDPVSRLALAVESAEVPVLDVRVRERFEHDRDIRAGPRTQLEFLIDGDDGLTDASH